MTAKEYLQQYGDAVEYEAQVREEYLEQNALINNIRSSLGGDGLPRGSDVTSEVEAKAIALAEKAQELKEAEIWAVATRQQIYKTIERVPGVPRDVLIERYVHLKKWKDVAAAVNYSVSHTKWNLHNRGLDYIQEMIDGKR